MIDNSVAVLLSTYNGEKYLREQLSSLYAQTYPNTSIFVRDDGSTDSTISILMAEKNKGRLNIMPSNANIGPASSFFNLLMESSSGNSFYAFCDQDDIWHPNKIEVAVNAIKEISPAIPVMYFSRLMFVDSENKLIKLSALPGSIGFGNALVENIATGCTVVMNKAARDLIVKFPPSQCVMHDSWCYLLISCLGEVVYDPFPSIHYRQHASNTIGASTSTLDTIKRRVRRFKFHKDGVFRFSNQAESFLSLYEDLIPPDKKQILVKFISAKKSFISRMALALNSNIWRQTVIDNLILRLLIIINRY